MNKKIIVIMLSVISIVSLSLPAQAYNANQSYKIKTINTLNGVGEIDQRQEKCNYHYTISTYGINEKIGQTFKASQGHNILSKIEVKFDKQDDPVDVTLSVKSRVSSSDTISSVTVNSANMDEEGWLEFDFKDCKSPVEQEISFVLELPENSNPIVVNGINYDNYYRGDAKFWGPAEGHWIDHTTDYFNLYDLTFRTYGYHSDSPNADFTFEDCDGYEPETKMKFDASNSNDPDGEIIEYRWWFEKEHYYDTLGEPDFITTDPVCYHEYDVTETSYNYVFLKVIDSSGLDDTAYEKTCIWVSSPPDFPEIDGPTEGKINVEYTFTFKSEDPEGDQIYYNYRWSGQEQVVTIGPYNSGEEVSISRSFSKAEDYILKVYAEDTHGSIKTEDGDPYKGLGITIKDGTNKMLPMKIALERIISYFPFLQNLQIFHNIL